jgi:hypothetical protein
MWHRSRRRTASAGCAVQDFGTPHLATGAHFFEAARQELTETAGLFDLSEHRLGQPACAAGQ